MSSGTRTATIGEAERSGAQTEVPDPIGSAARAGSAGGRAREAALVVETEIRPTSGWQALDFRELYAYRDLYRFLTWRGIKVRYAQSAIGIGWAVIQPLFTMLVFSLVFGTLAGVPSDGAPYKLFSLAALVPWTYFQNALNECSQSLVANANMISKVYFPRLILPLAAVTGKLVDFTIALCVLGILIAWFHFAPPSAGAARPEAVAAFKNAPAATGLRGVGRMLGRPSHTGDAHPIVARIPSDPPPWRFVPSFKLLALPLLAAVMVLTAAGLGAWLTALAIQYRDVKHAMTFVVQLLMYASPVVYPTSELPDQYAVLGRTVNPQQIYALNPLVGVIEGFRAALLGTQAMPWDLIAIGSAASIVIAFTGALYFRSRERLFADVA